MGTEFFRRKSLRRKIFSSKIYFHIKFFRLKEFSTKKIGAVQCFHSAKNYHSSTTDKFGSLTKFRFTWFRNSGFRSRNSKFESKFGIGLEFRVCTLNTSTISVSFISRIIPNSNLEKQLTSYLIIVLL